MGLKSLFSKPFSKGIMYKTKKWASAPVKTQHKVFRELMHAAKATEFGKKHHFGKIKSYEDFKKLVPLQDYEDLRPYIEKIQKGKKDVLWPGKPIYLSKTSGTTSGTKYIPLTKESIRYQLNGARDSILSYIHHTGKAGFVSGKMIFLQGSPELDTSGKVPVGRLSGIVANYVPAYLQRNRLPSYEVNCISDWESKVEAIALQTMNENMTLISGIPPWVQMYFEKLLEISGKKNIHELFPNFSLFIYGGVNYEPYRANLEKLIGKSVDSIELYPASEGFIAYQDTQTEEGMLLLLNSGIFYEFIKADNFFDEHPERINIESVELNVNYVIILSTNAGLWAYNIGDTVKFVSKEPYRIIVTGRIKHFTSAFGEHVIAEEVEKAMTEVCKLSNAAVSEFHLAPQVNPAKAELPYHEWFIEFSREPEDLADFSKKLNYQMMRLNTYYDDLIKGKVLQDLKVRKLKKNSFHHFMKSQGKLGGQNKLPRLSNDRKIADFLEKQTMD